MNRSNDLGFFYGPYGALGFVQRDNPPRLIRRGGLWRWLRKLMAR